MRFVIVFLGSSVISALLFPIPISVEVLRQSLILLVFLVILLVIFLVFVLANMMMRPDSFPDMKPSALLSMVLMFWNRKRRKMFDRICSFLRALWSHLISGCSICSGFARHIAQTVVEILKGDVFHKKS